MNDTLNDIIPKIYRERLNRGMVPDYTIDFEDGSKCLIELKTIPADSKSNISKNESYVSSIFMSLFLNYFKNSKCYFRCIDIKNIDNKQDSETLVGYIMSNTTVLFTGYEGIVCRECLKNPLDEIDGYMLFAKFKELKKRQKSEIWDDEYKRQVRSAVERVNKRFKDVFNLKDDVLIYSEIPVVVVNKKFLF